MARRVARGQALEEREADAALELAGDDGGVERLRFVAVAEGEISRGAQRPAAERVEEGKEKRDREGEHAAAEKQCTRPR